MVRPTETGAFYPASNPSGYISTGDADLRFVNVTGEETISGEKTFIDNVFFQSGIGVTGLIDFYLDQQAEPLEGQVGWHPDYGTLQIGMNGGEVVNPVGFKNFYRVKADSTIRKGFVAMAIGSVGNSEYILAKEAANIGSSGQLILGISAEEILPNNFGDVVAFGSVRGVNTSSFQEGEILYYDVQSTGGLTNQVPDAPDAKVIVAFVTKQNNNGVVFTRVSAGSEFGVTDSNVNFSNLANNETVFYNESSGVWLNKQISTGDVSGLYDFVTGIQGEFVTQAEASAQYVDLFADQTISGAKTFDLRPIVSGLGVVLSGEALNVVGDIVASGTISGSNLSGTNTGDQDLSGLVPYTGATSDVDIGGRNLSANQIIANTLTGGVEVVVGVVNADAITLGLTHINKVTTIENVAGVSVTIPTDIVLDLPVNGVFTLIQMGAGKLTLSSVGLTLNSFENGLTTAGQYAAIQIIKIAPNSWNVIGGKP